MRAGFFSLVLVATIAAGCVSSPASPPTPADDLSTYEPLAIQLTPHGQFSKLVCDPGGCLRRLTTMQEGPANEVMIGIDYSNPKFLVAGSKDYHADNPTCVVTSVYASTDAGRTWAAGYPRAREGALGGPSTDRCESDPAVTFDGNGNAFLITLDVSIGLFAYRSSDMGKTWKEVAMAFEGGNDKNWAATDYHRHRVYSITRATCDQGEAITYTDDAGESWSDPFCFASGDMDFAQVDVGPQGQVYAIGVNGRNIVFAKSTDGGENWTKTKKIGSFEGGQFSNPHPYRTPVLPDMAVALDTGAIYAAWHSGGGLGADQDVFFTASFDEGVNWTKQVELQPDEGQTGTDQFIPAVAASPKGDVHVIFFDARFDPTGDGHLLDVSYVHSTDATTFTPSLRLTSESFVPYLARHQREPFFIGDYVGLVATNNEAYAVFPITSGGRSEIHSVIVGG